MENRKIHMFSIPNGCSVNLCCLCVYVNLCVHIHGYTHSKRDCIGVNHSAFPTFLTEARFLALSRPPSLSLDLHFIVSLLSLPLSHSLPLTTNVLQFQSIQQIKDLQSTILSVQQCSNTGMCQQLQFTMKGRPIAPIVHWLQCERLPRVAVTKTLLFFPGLNQFHKIRRRLWCWFGSIQSIISWGHLCCRFYRVHLSVQDMPNERQPHFSFGQLEMLDTLHCLVRL